MKNFILLTLCLAGFIGVELKAQQRMPSISFTEEAFDFGKIKEADGPVSHTFSFTNTGSVPLLIQNAQPSCGCTTPDWTKQPVMPGTKGFIKATFDPNGRPGTFEKTVTVYSNADRSPLVLRFSGVVIPKPAAVLSEYKVSAGMLKLITNYMNMGDLAPSGKKDTSIRVVNSGNEVATVKFMGLPAWLKIEMVPASLKPNEKGEIKISYDASKKKDWGFLVDYVNFSVNDKTEPSYRLTIPATIKENFSKLTPEQLEKAPRLKFQNTTYNFETAKQGQKLDFEFKFTNEGKSDLIIRKVIPQCGCTTTSQPTGAIKPGASSTVKVRFDTTGKKDSQNKVITVISNDPNNSSMSLFIKGFVTSTDSKTAQ